MGLYDEDQDITIRTGQQLVSFLDSCLDDVDPATLLGGMTCVWESAEDLKSLVMAYTEFMVNKGDINPTERASYARDLMKKVKETRRNNISTSGIKETTHGYVINSVKDGIPSLKRLTNFTLQNVRATKLPGTSKYQLIVDIKVEGKIEKDNVIPARALASLAEFREACRSSAMARVEQDVTPHDFGRIIEHIDAMDIQYLNCVPYLGYHYDSNGVPFMIYNNNRAKSGLMESNKISVLYPDSYEDPGVGYYYEGLTHPIIK